MEFMECLWKEKLGLKFDNSLNQTLLTQETTKTISHTKHKSNFVEESQAGTLKILKEK